MPGRGDSDPKGSTPPAESSGRPEPFRVSSPLLPVTEMRCIRAAQAGGMEAVCATPEYGERIAANADNQKRLMDMPAAAFIDIQTKLRDLFMAGSDLPVFGVSEAELGSLGVPAVIVPGNDRVHDSSVGQKVHTMIPGSELHMLPIEDSDEPVIPFTEWSDLEPEIVGVFADFMRRHGAAGVSA